MCVCMFVPACVLVLVLVLVLACCLRARVSSVAGSSNRRCWVPRLRYAVSDNRKGSDADSVAPLFSLIHVGDAPGLRSALAQLGDDPTRWRK